MTTATMAELYPGVKIHESAYVDPPCEIGEGTKVWHFTHIMKNCVIGRRCNLGQNVVISPDVRLGDNVKVQNNVSIYTGCILEDDVFCGPSMVFTNVINPRSEIVRRDAYQRTLVRRGASLGANCTIVCGIEVGRYALIGAGAVITRDVPDYALMLGVPAKRVGWACRCGHTLRSPGKAGSRVAGHDDRGRLVCEACGNEYQETPGELSPLNEVQDER